MLNEFETRCVELAPCNKHTFGLWPIGYFQLICTGASQNGAWLNRGKFTKLF